MNSNLVKTIISVVGIGVFLFLAFGSGDSEKSTVDNLKAKISFTGNQFILTNNDIFDWTDVEIKINDSFILKTDRIKAGNVYTVGAMQFAKKDGTRFNPFTMKAQKVSIWCKTHGDKYGSYYGNWK